MLTLSNILLIIVAYNPATNLADKCKIAQAKYLIVDNSEKINQSIANYCASTTNCEYLPQNENTGIAKALNIGCDYAIQQGYQWAVTMDQDSTMTTEILQKMLDFANRFSDLNNTAIISPRHILQEGMKIKIKNEQEEYSQGIFTMSSGNLLNLSIWEKLKKFDEKLFIDMVDIDYYCKAMLNNYRVITINNLLMPHNLGNLQVKKLLNKIVCVFNHNHIRKYYQIRNALYVMHKYKNDVEEVKFLKRFCLNLIFCTLFYENDKLKKIKYIWLGYLDYRKSKLGKLINA